MSYRQPAFTIVELMVTVAVIGILSGITIQVSGNEWRRERVNAAVLELSGWLEAVRRASLRGEACTATVIPGTGIVGGATLATAAVSTAVAASSIPNNCLVATPARLPAITSTQTFTITTTQPTLTFTPRGTLSPAPTPDPAEIRVTLNGGGPGRCVVVRGLLGLVEIGRLEGGACVAGRF